MNVPDRQSPIGASRPGLLIVELWGLGDLMFATSLIAAATQSYDITLLAKPHARTLLAGTFPQLKFIEWDSPWTAFTGKYRLWKWRWRELIQVIAALRRLRAEVALSVRDDPRDHLLMWLSRAGRRIGFPTRGSGAWLTDKIIRPKGSKHKVEDWRMLAGVLRLENAEALAPSLAGADRSRGELPRICLHVGARIPVRRWPVANYAEVIRRLRSQFQFHLTVVPEPGEDGGDLAPLADEFLPHLDLHELIALLASSDLLICNDSAPGHLAAAIGTPVLAIFGPSDPVRYRPWGENHHVVIRDICPHRPCFDYCKFPEPYCLTRLTPDEVWPEIERFVAQMLPAGR